jgi:hypothetical protein
MEEEAIISEWKERQRERESARPSERANILNIARPIYV